MSERAESCTNSVVGVVFDHALDHFAQFAVCPVAVVLVQSQVVAFDKEIRRIVLPALCLEACKRILTRITAVTTGLIGHLKFLSYGLSH